MAKYVFADPHFYSEKIIALGERPFTSVSQMNKTIIQNYNSVINSQDICYWLGDIMYDASQDKVRKILAQMRGRKYLILGNHDRNHSVTWWEKCGFDRVSDIPLYDMENYILFSHEPLEEFGSNPPIVNYHGHIHIQEYDFENHDCSINACLEKTDYKPILAINPFIKEKRKFSR